MEWTKVHDKNGTEDLRPGTHRHPEHFPSSSRSHPFSNVPHPFRTNVNTSRFINNLCTTEAIRIKAGL